MKKIKLSKGKYTTVDDSMYATLSQYKWYCNNTGYAVRDIRSKGQKRCIIMHRVITNCPDTLQVDHIDGDRLNNISSNLRICSEANNHLNLKLRKNNKSGYKGVSWRPDRKKWRVRITAYNKDYHLGHFDTKEEAISVYKTASLIYHKEYSRKP